MNEPSTVTYPTADILKRIEDKLDSNHKEVNQKLDKMSERLTNLEVGQAKLTEKVEGMDKRLERVENTQDTLVKEVSDLKGFRSLILPLIIGGISAIIGG
ncbi:hypothetical protein [Cyanothece sp. BG0011]|uniref:hypothetical protein n=1 Tax=Cyanothece sp. BG0011 TaxID=2082950 RepID=UPI000D1E69EA|nr:hypothetical protein [Cyanothece sp. BG0011]